MFFLAIVPRFESASSVLNTNLRQRGAAFAQDMPSPGACSINMMVHIVRSSHKENRTIFQP